MVYVIQGDKGDMLPTVDIPKKSAKEEIVCIGSLGNVSDTTLTIGNILNRMAIHDSDVLDRLRNILLFFHDIKKFDGIDSPVAALRGDGWGLINLEGNYLGKGRYDDIVQAFKYDDELYFSVLVGDKYGLIDSNGTLVCEPIYDTSVDALDGLNSNNLDSRFDITVQGTGVSEFVKPVVSQSIDNMILKLLSSCNLGDNGEISDDDRKMLIGKLDNINGIGIDDYIVRLESRLKFILSDNVLNVLFGNNREQVINSSFSLNDLNNYVNANYCDGYLNTTDFGKKLTDVGIYFTGIGNDNVASIGVNDEKYLLSVQNAVLSIDIPFIEQSHHGSGEFKVNIDDKGNIDGIEVKYLGNEDIKENIIRLIEFLKAISSYSTDTSNNRRLGIFGVDKKK